MRRFRQSDAISANGTDGHRISQASDNGYHSRSAVRELLRRASGVRERLVTYRWARRAFADFEAGEPARQRMLTGIVIDARYLSRLANRLGREGDGNARGQFADALLEACQRLDSGEVRHTSAKMRSYVDVT